MTPLGLTHTAAALLALGSGAAVLVMRKGTTRHRQVGWVYVSSMLALNGTALFIFRLFGGVGPFHVFAIFSLITVILAVRAGANAGRHRRARQMAERARAVEQHFAWMTWSYVGLAAAAVSEVATRVPAFRPGPGQGATFGLVVGVATLLVVGVGSQMIRRRKAALLAPYATSAALAE